MNKYEFLTELRSRLSGLPIDEINKSLDYYSEIIDDSMDDGICEEEAVRMVGSVDAIATQILQDGASGQHVKAKQPATGRTRGWMIALLVLGFPLWFPLLVAGGSVLLALFAVAWSVILSLYAVVIALGASVFALGVCLVIAVVQGKLAVSMCMLGGTLVLAGLTILSFLGVSYAVRALLYICKKTFLLIKSWFCKKEGTA